MEFVQVLVPLTGALLLLLLLAKLIAGKADRSRGAEISEGRTIFAPNRRSFWGAYLFIGCFALVTLSGLVNGAETAAGLAVPCASVGFVLLLLMAFPATIVADEKGLEQTYWLRGRRRIAWNEIAHVDVDEKNGEIKIIGRGRVKIVHTRQLADKQTFLAEVEKHRVEEHAVAVAPPEFAMSGPAA